MLPILLAAALSVPLRAGALAQAPTQGIDHHNRLLLVRARVVGKTDGIVLVLTRMGATARVIERLRALGAEIQARFDDVGYVRARLPLAHFAQVRAIPDVVEARIDAGYLSYGYDQGTDSAAIKLLERAVEQTKVRLDTTAPLPPPLDVARLRPDSNPYVPMAEMGSPQFRRAYPTYDGRGVTIGVLESGALDLTHPALQRAQLIAGDSVGKVVGIIAPSSYAPGPEPPSLGTLLGRDITAWSDQVWRTGPMETSEGTFSVEGRLYHAPRSGRYSFGAYRTPGHTDDALYGVLWDSSGNVWVDTNRDRDFRDEVAIQDFNRTHTVGLLRRDSTIENPQRSVPFVVTFDSGGTALHLYEGTQSHQTMVASVAAGHGILGVADASAPGSRLVIVDAGWSLGDAIEGFIRAERDPRIDLITSSQVGETFPGTGESIFALVLERLVRRYGKPIFAAADNTGPRMSLTGEPGNAPGVISVGGYASGDSYRAHYGWRVPSRDWLLSYSGRGPTLDGAMKPDVVAPVLSIAAAPCSEAQPAARYLLYSLPPCYTLGAGTSSATPHAAGAGALLVSAAKQAHVPYDASRLAWALRTGARSLAGYGVNEQGGGLVDVRRAWDLLKGAIEVPEIQSTGPVHTTIDRYLRRPGRGRGLYEREGWAPGDTGTQVITLTRTSGRDRDATYRLRWRGNDGTFRLAASRVRLPLGVPVEVRVHIAPRTTGVHSAALEIVDRGSDVAVHQVLATVIAAEQLTAANDYTVRLHGRAEWPRSMPFFVNVPAGTAALRVAMHVAAGRLSLATEDPATLDNLEWQAYFKGYRYPFSLTTFVTPSDRAGGVRLIPRPFPGVWELRVGPVGDPVFGGDSAQYHVAGDVELVVSAVGAAVAPRADSGGRVTLAFSNNLASLVGAASVAEVGMRRTQAGMVDSAMPGPELAIRVDSGTTSLRVAVEPMGDTTAHLDLYLFDCTTGTCFLWDVDFVHDRRAELLVRAPRPGTWKAIIDPARIPSGTTTFSYTETMTNPAYGSVGTDTVSWPRAAGEGWVEAVTPTVGAAIPQGYARVVVADLVDQAAEAEEKAHPLAVFGGLPYRPAVVGTAVAPLDLQRGSANR